MLQKGKNSSKDKTANAYTKTRRCTAVGAAVGHTGESPRLWEDTRWSLAAVPIRRTSSVVGRLDWRSTKRTTSVGKKSLESIDYRRNFKSSNRNRHILARRTESMLLLVRSFSGPSVSFYISRLDYKTIEQQSTAVEIYIQSSVVSSTKVPPHEYTYRTEHSSGQRVCLTSSRKNKVGSTVD